MTIGSFIPGAGLAFDAISTGAIIGEAVDFYANKKKEAQAEQKQAVRQTQIEKDVSTEQSELIAQGVKASQSRGQAVAQQVAQSQPLPTSQVGFEPS